MTLIWPRAQSDKTRLHSHVDTYWNLSIAVHLRKTADNQWNSSVTVNSNASQTGIHHRVREHWGVAVGKYGCSIVDTKHQTYVNYFSTFCG